VFTIKASATRSFGLVAVSVKRGTDAASVDFAREVGALFFAVGMLKV
jgi:hypothetical protein